MKNYIILVLVAVVYLVGVAVIKFSGSFGETLGKILAKKSSPKDPKEVSSPSTMQPPTETLTHTVVTTTTTQTETIRVEEFDVIQKNNMPPS